MAMRGRRGSTAGGGAGGLGRAGYRREGGEGAAGSSPDEGVGIVAAAAAGGKGGSGRLQSPHPMTDTPATLLDRLRRPGDATAWAQFVHLYTPLLYRWAQQ